MTGFYQDLAALLERGGLIMWPLIGLSVVSLALIFERSWFWLVTHRSGRGDARFIRINAALRRGDRTEVTKLVEADRGPCGELVRRLLGEGTSDAVAVEAVDRQRPRIDRFMVTLSTIVTAAPLLGILGTVIGIIRSFRLLGAGEQELTDPGIVSAGIAEALLTTAMGLVVALVTLFPYMLFRGQVDRAMGQLESLIAAAQEGVSTPKVAGAGSR